MDSITKNNKKKSKLRPGKRSMLWRDSGIEWMDEIDRMKPVRGEQAVWRAVILQALEDAASNSKKAKEQYHKIEALNWLEGRSEDFVTVCDLAGLIPTEVRKSAKIAILNGCKWRLEAGHGKKAKAKLQEKQLPVFETKTLKIA